MPKTELEILVKNSDSLKSILRYFNLQANSNYKTLKARLKFENIDYSHMPKINRKLVRNGISLNEILVENSSYTNRNNIKKRLIEDKILINECAICKLSNTWQNKSLVFVLDHINGVNDDNRIENLRLLCPNCNSQTDTFAGRNNKKNINKIYQCKYNCGNVVKKRQTVCDSCKSINKRKVKNRPNINMLLLQIKEFGYEATGRLYGVTGNAIRKWLK